ncbi:hypothetical protein [Catellatospora citrea]|uniref:hypothetical protein n=1 Tax=Catellatospora citrea TaxID=53366 RepID=UPI000E731C4E|nr:hypothetical protein [Catellatospora citrea]RKE09014.1 hypothetical protein C8E86_3890 [Catellatospora citrea]
MIRPPWRRWTLRTRMVVAVVALAGVALLITDFLAATTLRHTLAQQLDEDVRELNRFGGGGPWPGGFGNRPPTGPDATRTPSGLGTGQPGPAAAASPSPATRGPPRPRPRPARRPRPTMSSAKGGSALVAAVRYRRARATPS